MNFYHVVSLSETMLHPTEGCVANLMGKVICAGCSAPRPGISRVDVQLEELPGQAPIQKVSGLGIGVIRKSFLDALGQDLIEKHFFLGSVTDENGRNVPELISLRGKHQTIVRGNPDSTFRACNTCGRPMYFPIGTRYILKGTFSFAPVSQSNLTQLVVNDEILDRIDLKRWKKIGIEELPIVDAPTDGLLSSLEGARG